MKKLTKQLVAVAMAAAVFFSQSGMTVMANSADSTSFKASGIEILSVEEFTEEASVVEETTVEETTVVVEETTVEETTEVVEETTVEETTVVVEETTVEETTEVVEETTVEETTEVVEETTVEETTEVAEEVYVFPGLPEGTVLSTAQVAEKKELAGYVSDIKSYLSGVNYVEGEVLVEAATSAEADVYAEAYGGVVAEYNENRGIARITLPEGATVEQAVMASSQVTTYSDNEKVLPAAWPNYLEYTCEEVMEKAEPESAISGYSDANLDEQWHHEYMGSEYAWLEGYTGAGVKVAVIDTGILKTHEDLSKNTQNGREFVASYGNTDNNDYQGHGTHVAGIIAADGNNGKGGSGVAPDATVRSYRVFGKSGGASVYDIIDAVDAAVADGNNIINMSLSGAGYYGPYHDSIKDAINEGVAVFVAAGNESTNSTDVYPANFKEACTIGALNLSGGAATFSNYGSHVDLAFPGVDIYSTYNESNTAYTYMNGTSMATPAAAGAAAVILSANPKALQGKTGKAKVNALISLMQSSAIKSSSGGMGKGTTWIPKACGLSGVDGKPVAPKFSKAQGTYKEESISVTITAEKGKKIYYSTNGKNPSYKNGVVTNATVYTGPVTITGAANVTLKAIAVSANGLVSSVTSAKYTLKPERVTKITLTQANNINTLAQGKNFTLNASFAPAYATDKAVEWSVSPADKGVTVKNGKVTASMTADTSVSNYRVTAKMKNYGTVYATYDFKVVAAEKMVSKVALTTTKETLTRKPGATSPTVNLGAGVTITYSDRTTSASAANLDWTSSNTSVATVSSTGVVTAKSAGTATITALAKDGSGKKATAKITVVDNVTSITISGAQQVAKGKNITLKATVTPAKSKNAKLNWTVTPADKGVTVNNGKVTAGKDADTSITYKVKATTTDGSVSSAEFPVKVVTGAISKITFTDKSKTIFTKKATTSTPTSVQLVPVITGSEGFNSSLITYTSSTPEVATVSQSGLVTAKAVGKTTITVVSTDGSNKKATITVNVNLPMSGLKIAPKGGATMYVGKGKSINYGALVYGEYGTPTNKNVTWSVANESIAKVDKNGKVTGLAYGTTTLYAKAADGSGVVASYTIEVIQPATRFSLDMSDWLLYDVIVFNTNSDIINKTAAYKVDISGNGCSVVTNYSNAIELTYTKKGTYTVKVTLLDGSNKSAKVTFRIY